MNEKSIERQIDDLYSWKVEIEREIARLHRVLILKRRVMEGEEARIERVTESPYPLRFQKRTLVECPYDIDLKNRRTHNEH